MGAGLTAVVLSSISVGFNLAPMELSDRIPFLALAQFAALHELHVPIFFPQLQSLIAIEPAKIAIALLFMPAFFLAAVSNMARRVPTVGVPAVSLTAIRAAFDFRATTFTSRLRRNADVMAFHGFVLIVVACLILTWERQFILLSVLPILAMVSSEIATQTPVRRWDICGRVSVRFRSPIITVFHHDLWRTGGAAAPTVFNYKIIWRALSLQYFRHQELISFGQPWLLHLLVPTAANSHACQPTLTAKHV